MPAPAAAEQLTGQHAPAATPALTPADAQRKFVVPEGFAVRLFAAEPDVVNPVAMTWDGRGRLWVLELYEYPLGAPPGALPRDRIRILEDTDNDGRADRVKVFADGLNLATGILIGNGGLYVGESPNLLFLRDTNHDDRADSREVLLTGFGLDDRHELLNGFIWGPDGWLYMTHGVFTHSKVKIPEAPEPGVEMNAAVARFHPRTKKFEIFADGTSNPWGVDFDRFGNAFVSACVIDHLFHMTPGGIYERQGGTPGNPYAYELLPSIVGHMHYMAAYCGVCIYEGANFPTAYRGRVFMGNIHQHAINQDRLIPNGSSFRAVAEKDFLTTSDGWFMPVSLQVGPDGALWVADWYDKYPCYQNAQADPKGVDRERGRIWRVICEGRRADPPLASRPDAGMNLEKMLPSELVTLLWHTNQWQVRTAQRLLAETLPARHQELDVATSAGSPNSVKGLRGLLREGPSLSSRLAALWALHGAGFLSDAELDELAHDGAPSVRAWVARLTAERVATPMPQLRAHEVILPGHQAASERIETALSRLEMLAGDPDPTVRLAVATAVRQFVSSSLTVDADIKANLPVGELLATLTRSAADAKDPLLPFMIWMAAQPLVAHDPKPWLDWLVENGAATMPLSAILTRKAMRRICDTQDAAKLNLAVEFLEQTAMKDTVLARAAIDGVLDGQKAKPLLPTQDTGPLFAKLDTTEDAQLGDRARQLGALWGNTGALKATLKIIADAEATTESRVQAIQALRHSKGDRARDALRHVIAKSNAEPVVVEAIRVLGYLGGDAATGDLLASWMRFTSTERAAAVDVLISRRQSVAALLSAIEVKRISAADLPASAVQALARSPDEFTRRRVEQVIGRIRPADADKQELIAEKRQMILADGPTDGNSGHELARKTCFVCHKLNGEGAEIGPDLTGVGRSSLEALLANVIDPNQVIGHGYQAVEVETKDGRTVSGRLVEDTATHVKLLSSGPKEDVIAKSDIARRRVGDLSVMPENLEQMPDKDFRDMILFILNAH